MSPGVIVDYTQHVVPAFNEETGLSLLITDLGPGPHVVFGVCVDDATTRDVGTSLGVWFDVRATNGSADVGITLPPMAARDGASTRRVCPGGAAPVGESPIVAVDTDSARGRKVLLTVCAGDDPTQVAKVCGHASKRVCARVGPRSCCCHSLDNLAWSRCVYAASRTRASSRPAPPPTPSRGVHDTARSSACITAGASCLGSNASADKPRLC